MPYYVWKRNGKIVAYDYSSISRLPPAIKISDDEAKKLGIYVPVYSEVNEIGTNDRITDSELGPLDLTITSYRQGVNEAE